MSSKNPYIVGNPVGNSPTFVGRTDILQNVWGVMRDPQQNSIVLYGQRRIGKTSVLQELKAQLSQKENYHPVFFDLQDKAQWSLGRVIGDLADKIAEPLNLVSPNLGNDPETSFRQDWLPKILNTLPTDTSLVLLFDEFDVLANPESEQAGAAFFPYLRDLLTVHFEHLNAVFAIGRNIEDLTSIAWALFKDVATSQKVSLLNYEETVKLIRLSEDRLNWSNNEVIDQIWQLTNGHPFLTQSLCYGIWERLCDEKLDKPPTVTLADVKSAIPDTLNARRNQLEWLWDGLQSAERMVASTLASAGAEIITEVQLYELLRKSGVPIIIRELQNAPRLLQEWDFIETVAGGFRFRVELLRYWIADNKKPNKIHVELDRLDPAADILYQAGQKLYQANYREAAIVPLQQAIDLNANHVGANLLLADILLKQKQSKEALKILEKIYRFRPVAARTALIETLLTLAQTTERRKDKRKYYQRILDIEPEHPEAKKQLAKIPNVWQSIKPQQWMLCVKTFFNRYAKRTLEMSGIILALWFSYYWLGERLPTNPLIVFEIEQDTELPQYAITGVIADKPYQLELVKIYPRSHPTIKKATFKYNGYPDIELVKKSKRPYYKVSREFLQQQWEEEQNFVFEFLDNHRMSFAFEFEQQAKNAEFDCQVFSQNNTKIPCEIKEKGYLSLFQNIPWFLAASALCIVWLLLIEFIFFIRKRKRDDIY